MAHQEGFELLLSFSRESLHSGFHYRRGSKLNIPLEDTETCRCFSRLKQTGAGHELKLLFAHDLLDDNEGTVILKLY
jgi:hypothetical protein